MPAVHCRPPKSTDRAGSVPMTTQLTRVFPVHPAGGARRSLWLQEALALEPDADQVTPLHGAVRAEVCIVGGGYTGLWTALRLKEMDPALDVAIVEADLCGSGAS